MSDDVNRRYFLKQSAAVSAGVVSGLSLGQKALAAKAKFSEASFIKYSVEKERFSVKTKTPS